MDGESRFSAAHMKPPIRSTIFPILLSFSYLSLAKLENGKPGRRAKFVARSFFLSLFACFSLYAPLVAQFSSKSTSTEPHQVFLNEALLYRMVSGQTNVGEARINITCDQAAGVIHFVESVSGLFERSTVLTVRNDSTLRSLSSSTVFGREPRFHAVRLRYAESAIAGEIEQPREYGGLQEIHQQSRQVVHDFFAVPHVLRAGPLSLNSARSFPIFDFRQKRVTAARVWVAKKELLSVPAGQFSCYRLEGFSGKLRWIFWIDESFPHRLIKQHLPGMDVKLELVEFGPNAGVAGEGLKSSSSNLY